MEKLSAALLVYNSEEHIRECLESLKWADEIVILDGFSTDKTVDICREFTDKVYQRKFTSFNEERMALIEKTSYKWIFMVDSDMVVPKELAEEIRQVLQNPDCSGYNMSALTYLWGRPVRHQGWFDPTYLRLFNKEKGAYDIKLKYLDHFIVREGKTGVLKNHLVHYGYKDFKQYIDKINRYTTLDAQDLSLKGRKFALWKVLFRPVMIFFDRYFYKLGFLDGMVGLIIAVFTMFTYMLSYFKLWELENK